MKPKAPAAGDMPITLDVSLLGRDYKVACKPGEEGELREAVAFLEHRMRDIRAASKTNSPERVAVMAALNLAHDLERMRGDTPAVAGEGGGALPVDVTGARRRIAAMHAAIDQVLPAQEKLL